MQIYYYSMNNNSRSEQQVISIYSIIWTWILSLFIQKQVQRQQIERPRPRDPNGLYYYDLDENVATMRDMENYFSELYDRIIFAEKSGRKQDTIKYVTQFINQCTGTMYHTFIKHLSDSEFNKVMQREQIVQSIINGFIN